MRDKGLGKTGSSKMEGNTYYLVKSRAQKILLYQNGTVKKNMILNKVVQLSDSYIPCPFIVHNFPYIFALIQRAINPAPHLHVDTPSSVSLCCLKHPHDLTSLNTL